MKYNNLVLIALFIFLFSCQKRENELTDQLILLGSYDLSIPEPSGLNVNSTGDILYIVSDNTNQIYQINSIGVVLQTYGYVGNDLEGISNFINGKFLVAEERTKNIVEYNPTTNSFISHQMVYNNNDANSGIEGVTYNPNNQTIYFVNEKNPGKLFKTDINFNITSILDLTFANDYSDLFYESQTNILWILSDESRTINKCTTDGILLQSYSINVDQPEGIAITSEKIYIVSDSLKKLYIFQKPM